MAASTHDPSRAALDPAPSRSPPLSPSGAPSLAPGRTPIRAWPASERPRERLLTLGPRGLAVRELLAILIGSGPRGASAFDVADRLLHSAGEPPVGGSSARGSSAGGSSVASVSSAGTLRALARRAPESLTLIDGLGKAGAARVAAALELGRRTAAEAGQTGDGIRGPEDVFRRMGPLMRDLRQEEFHALLLDAQHRVLRDVVVTRGILDASLIHPREVFREAIAAAAAAVVLVHNHPSGDPAPSAEDRAVTRQLAEAGRAVGIPVLDHVVVGDGRWASVPVGGA